MKYAIEIQNDVIVAIHSFNDDTPIPQHLVPVDTLDNIVLGQPYQWV